MYNLKPSRVSVAGIGGAACTAELEGDLCLEFVNEKVIVALSQVLYVPDLGYNLFSPTSVFDGLTYDVMGGPDKIMTAFGGDVVFRLGRDNLLSSKTRRIDPS